VCFYFISIVICYVFITLWSLEHIVEKPNMYEYAECYRELFPS